MYDREIHEKFQSWLEEEKSKKKSSSKERGQQKENPSKLNEQN